METGSRDSGRALISWISLVVSIATLCLVSYALIFRTAGDNEYTTEKKLAGELSDNNLFKASVEEYKKILTDRSIDPFTAANINYLIGKIYFENMADYENAAAYYVRARALNPNGSFFDEAGKNMITCLEKMGRMVDAKRELDRAVNLDSVKASEKGQTVVARVGDSPIFLTDLDEAIQTLPPEMQKKYLDRAGKIEMLNQMVGMELMYKAALREGYDKEPSIIKKEKQVEKQLLVERYLTEKALPQVNIDTIDVYNYYLANRKEKYGDKPYDEVKATALMDYQQEKAQKAFSDYIAKLAAVEKVQLFEENVR